MPNTKAALTIGMNYSGSNKLAGMPTLKAAAECAHQMADFLSSEYDVRCITDVDHGPISPADVEAELDNFFVKDGIDYYRRYEMLVVYFAGHGVTANASD